MASRLRLRRQRARPAGPRRGRATAPPIAADARLLRALDAVQRLGPVRAARPRVTNDRQYYRPGDGQDQLWRVAPGRGAARSTPPTTAGSRSRSGAWASPARTSPATATRGLPDEPGRQQAPDAPRRARRSRPTATSPSSAASTSTQPFDRRRRAAVHGLAPGVRGRQQRRLHRPVRLEGQRRTRRPTTRRGTRATCSSASPTGRSSRRAEAAGIVSFERGRGAALADFNLDGLLDLVEVNYVRPGAAVAERRPRRRRRSPRRWATGSALAGRAARPEPRRDRRVGRGPDRRPDAAPRADGRRRPRRRQLGWIHVGLGPATRRAGPGHVARRRGRAVARRRRRTRFAIVERGATAIARRGRRPAMMERGDDDAIRPARRRRPARLRDARPASPSSRRRSTRRAWTRCASVADERGYDRLVVYADREHSANLAYLTGFDPRFEEAMLVVGPAGEPALLVGNECFGMAGAAPLPIDATCSRTSACPASRATARGRSRDPRRRGIGPGSRVGVVGWKTYADRATDRGAGLPRRHAARADRRDRARRERHRPAHRRRPTACASSTRSSSSRRSSTPPARPRTASGTCSSACGPG